MLELNAITALNCTLRGALCVGSCDAMTGESRSRSLEWNVDEECGESDKDRIVQGVFSAENTSKIIQNT